MLRRRDVHNQILRALQRGGRWSVGSLKLELARAGAPASETCISACVRDLRKAKHGAHRIHGRRELDGEYRYYLEDR